MTQDEDKSLLKFLQEQEAKGYILSLHFTLCITFLLYTEERRQTKTSTRL
jgi:hypothetical protein